MHKRQSINEYIVLFCRCVSVRALCSRCLQDDSSVSVLINFHFDFKDIFKLFVLEWEFNTSRGIFIHYFIGDNNHFVPEANGC